MPVQFTILGSGSSGNCAYLETGQTRILIDAGFSGRQIRKRLGSIGRTPERLDGILITHEHTDHTKGLATLAAKLGIPVYCNRLTREALESQVREPFECRVFATGSEFEIGDVTVDNFSVPHDACDPVGFLLHTSEANIGVLTDLGHTTKLVVERIRESHVLLLEANHDLNLLQQDTRRPWSIKQRILSRHGHLSNDAAAELLEQVLTDELRHLYLGHLSRDCNTPKLAQKAADDCLAKLEATHVRVMSTFQDEPSETLILERPKPPALPKPSTIPEPTLSPDRLGESVQQWLL